MLNVTQRYETDVLVVGGGVGGLMAAIYAAEKGARVLVADKAHTLRSGSGATGNDHFRCYIPEVHGPDIMRMVSQTLGSMGKFYEPDMCLAFLERSFGIVRRWEEWGVVMRPHGVWHFAGHAMPGALKPSLKYNGANQKKVLTERAKKRGVTLLHHHPTVDLLTADGAVAGALLLDVSEPKPRLALVRAKATIMATGASTRLYPGVTPGVLFNEAYCPGGAGAVAQAWRAGARLVNMEMPNRWAGPKYLNRCGKATWIGVYKYPDGRCIGPFVTRPDREHGDFTSDAWNTVFTDVMRNGTGPAYIDCSEGTPDDIAFQREGMISEGLTALLDYMDAKGIDPARHAVEFTQYAPILFGRGVDCGPDGAASLPGLFAAGDMVGNCGGGIAVAACFGAISGESAAAWSRNRELPEPAAADVRRCEERVSALYGRRGGASWQEANFALQQIMGDYAPAGPDGVRSETLLNAGRKYLADLRTDTLDSLSAACSHTLMRALEVLDLLDCGAALMEAALARRETRGLHRRADYTFTNPMLNEKLLTIRLEGDRPVTEWRLRRPARS